MRKLAPSPTPAAVPPPSTARAWSGACRTCITVFMVSMGNITECSARPAMEPATQCCDSTKERVESETKGWTGAAIDARGASLGPQQSIQGERGAQQNYVRVSARRSDLREAALGAVPFVNLEIAHCREGDSRLPHAGVRSGPAAARALDCWQTRDEGKRPRVSMPQESLRLGARVSVRSVSTHQPAEEGGWSTWLVVERPPCFRGAVSWPTVELAPAS